MVKERIYGIDPGSIEDPAAIENMNEIDLFFKIDSLGKTIFQAWHQTKNSESPADTTEEEYALAFCAYQTRRFGVRFPEVKPGKPITKNSSYDAWYHFYYDHFYNNLKKKDLKKFVELKDKGKIDFSYLPSGSWRDYLKNN